MQFYNVGKNSQFLKSFFTQYAMKFLEKKLKI